MRWRKTVFSCVLAATMMLIPAAQVHALDYGVGLEATTIPWGGTFRLIDGQFSELYFWLPVPNYVSSVVNSIYVARDNGDFLETGRVYNASATQGIPLRNPVGFVTWSIGWPYPDVHMGFMDGLNHPGYDWEPDIHFDNGRWYGFGLERDRTLAHDYEVWVWDPVTGARTHVAWWAYTQTGIVSARGVLGTERQYAGSTYVDPDYGTFNRSQFRTYNGSSSYALWTGGLYPTMFVSNDWLYWQFYLNRLNDRWIYCNTSQIN